MPRSPPGPGRPEGKATGGENAVTQGRLARAAVLQGEEWEEWTCFREEMYEELYPDGMQEAELAGRIVDLSWRLRRAGQYQNAVFEALYDQQAAEAGEPVVRPEAEASVPADPVLGRMLVADFSGARVLERVLLYERRIESSLYRARAELRQLRNQRVNSARRGAASVAGKMGWGLDTDEPAMSARNRWRQTEANGSGQGPQGGSQESVAGSRLGTAGQTNPISGPLPLGRAAFPGGPACQTKPMDVTAPGLGGLGGDLEHGRDAHATEGSGCETKPISVPRPLGRAAVPGDPVYQTEPMAVAAPRVWVKGSRSVSKYRRHLGYSPPEDPGQGRRQHHDRAVEEKHARDTAAARRVHATETDSGAGPPRRSASADPRDRSSLLQRSRRESI